MRDDEIDDLIDDVEDESSTIDAAEEEIMVEDKSSTLQNRVAILETTLQQADQARLRALADYQNLQRRSLADRANWSKLATQDLLLSILDPLEHLRLAAEQLNDPGLTMVVKQLFDRLQDQGFKKIDALGKPFDAETMEAIEGSKPEGKKVAVVVRNGYTLNGFLIQPAKVTIE